MHDETHPQAGRTVTVRMKHPQLDGEVHRFEIEDWWDKLTGRSWGASDSNPAAMVYAMRGAMTNLPMDDEVVYGHIGTFGHLVHVSEIVG